jgi:DNA polymerase III delta prime subunit
MLIPEFLRLLPFLPFNNLPQPRAVRSRQKLLKIMETEVNIRLDDSMYYQELMQLYGEGSMAIEQPEHTAVNSDLAALKQGLQPERSLEIFGSPHSQLDSSEKIIDVFDRDDIAGRLLILGAPGSGKTTTLLELARDLIQRAQQQPEQPIPVLFELSNWKDHSRVSAKRHASTSFAEWLATDLNFRHNVPKVMTRKWIKTGQLLPLLDNLDELELTQQMLCLQRIHEFVEASLGHASVVICGCQDESIKGEAILETLRGAVCLQPLTEKQIEAYLRQLGCGHLWQPIEDDPEGLLSLAKVPLLLTLLPVAYLDGLKRRERSFSDPRDYRDYWENYRQDLFDAYIKHRLEQPHNHRGYKPEDTKRWLIWLAKTLKEQQQTDFLIERMQPILLKTSKRKQLYQLICGLIGGLIGGGIGGGIYELWMGIIIGFIMGTIYVFNNYIEFHETSIFFLGKPKNWLIFGMSLAVGIGLISWLASGLILGVINRLIFWLIFGALGGIMIGLIVGMEGDEIKTKNKPNQGIKESIKNAIIIGLISIPAGMLLYALLRVVTGQSVELVRALTSGLGLALFLGIGYGGLAGIQHGVLRMILWRSGAIPWNYARFLNYAAQRRLLKPVGGRYRFIHNLLRDRFAEMSDS